MCDVDQLADCVPASAVAIPPPPATRGWGIPAIFVEGMAKHRMNRHRQESLNGHVAAPIKRHPFETSHTNAKLAKAF